MRFEKSEAEWVTEAPPGHSSPSIWGNHIYLTTAADGKLECRAYERSSGKLLWTRPVEAKEIENTHAFNNPAASTPAADEKVVIFYFGSYGLVAYTALGELAWNQSLPKPATRYGSSSSPVLWGDLVIQPVDTDEGGSRLYAFKRSNGEKAWETPRPLMTSGYSTPIVRDYQGTSELILLGSKKLIAYNPANGQETWSIAGFPIETVPSPAYEGDLVFACSAAMGGRANPKFDSVWPDLIRFDQNKDGKVQPNEVPESYRILLRSELPEGHPGRLLPFSVRDMMQGMDTDKDGAVTQQEWENSLGEFEKRDRPVLMAIRTGKSTTSFTNRIAWEISKGIPETPSPLAYRGKLYLIRDGGILQCIDAKSGNLLYQERVGVRGGYSASPVAAQDRIYLASQSGGVVVIDAQSSQLNVLARNSLDEQITATPALVENHIYIRTDKHLFAFSGKDLPEDALKVRGELHSIEATPQE